MVFQAQQTYKPQCEQQCPALLNNILMGTITQHHNKASF